MFFISSCPLGLLHLCGEGYRLSGANKLCCYLSLKARWSHNKEFNISPQHKLTFCATTALDFKPYTEDSVNSTIQLNKHSPLLTHNFSPFCYQETSDRTSVLPVTLQQVLFPPPPQYLHESQESVQDVNSQNKRFSCKAKEVGQTPEIFHLGIPLSRAQSVFILHQEKSKCNSSDSEDCQPSRR